MSRLARLRERLGCTVNGCERAAEYVLTLVGVSWDEKQRSGWYRCELHKDCAPAHVPLNSYSSTLTYPLAAWRVERALLERARDEE